jgi:hypothetical protein
MLRERGRGNSGDSQSVWQLSCQSSRFCARAENMNRMPSRRLVFLGAIIAASCHASYPVAPTDPTPLSFQIYYRNPVAFASVGSFYSFDAYVLRADGAYENVTSQTTWSSSDPAVLRQSTSSFSTFNAVASGPADVIGRYRGLSSSVSMFVTRPDRRVFPQLSIGLQPFPPWTVGQKGQATANVLEIGAPAIEVVTDLASWSSSNPDVLRVERGAWAVVAPGTAHITASYNGLSAFVAVSVHPPRQAQ